MTHIAAETLSLSGVRTLGQAPPDVVRVYAYARDGAQVEVVWISEGGALVDRTTLTRTEAK